MSSILTGNKLAQDMREKLIKQTEKKTKSNDPRFLNYYDLEDGQEMEVLLLADPNGELIVSYKTHGDGLKVRGAGKINCSYSSSGEACPACMRSFEFWDAGDEENNKKWRAREHHIAQVVVLKSPVEVPDSPDGNVVKLFNMPFRIKEMITDGMLNGTVPDPTEQVLVIKRTKNKGGFANYDKSFFRPGSAAEHIPEDVVAAAENGNLKTFDLSLEVPAATTGAEVQAWLDKADEAVLAAASRPAQAATTSSVKAPVTQATTTTEGAAQSATPSAGGSSIRDRLNALKNR